MGNLTVINLKKLYSTLATHALLAAELAEDCYTALMDDSIRKHYVDEGVSGYYQQHGATYRNPHEAAVQHALRTCLVELRLEPRNVLDLACGSGEVTLVLQQIGLTEISGMDPYTYDAYFERTGLVARSLTFEQIADGALSTEHYDLVVCSYALHLAEKSRLPTVCYQLALVANQLLILTPHKRPNIRAQWGWSLLDERLVERVRCRYYHSTLRQTI